MKYLAPLLAVILAACSQSTAQTPIDTITWKHPTSYTDGSALVPADIQSTQLQWGTAKGGPYNVGSKTVLGTATSTTVNGRTSGLRCYVAMTVDKQGRVSAPSVEACKLAVAAPANPSPPTDVTVE